jgi:hypothetical protein
MNEEDYHTWHANKSLVKFINSAVDDFPLDIDILYEKNSITYHSLTPAQSRLIMLTKLSKSGILITNDSISPTTAVEFESSSYSQMKALLEEIRVDIVNFNHAVSKSLQFKSHHSVKINNTSHQLNQNHQIISRSVLGEVIF